MRTEKGITLVSLTIYILAMFVVIGLLTIITRFYYNNVNPQSIMLENAEEFNKFTMFFLEDVKSANEITECLSTGLGITFDNNIIYSTNNNTIYRNDIKVCENIRNVNITTSVENNKTVITVQLEIGESNTFLRTLSYVLT